MKMAYLSEEQLKRLLESVPDEMNRLRLLVTYWHGLRVSEMLALTGWSIRSGFLRTDRLKGSEPTVQPFIWHPDPILDEATPLLAIAETVKESEPIFVPMTRDGVLKMMKRHGKLVGLPEPLLHPHALKHSLAQHGLERGMSLPDLQKLLGHKSLSSTGQYLKSNDIKAAAALRKAMGI